MLDLGRLVAIGDGITAELVDPAPAPSSGRASCTTARLPTAGCGLHERRRAVRLENGRLQRTFGRDLARRLFSSVSWSANSSAARVWIAASPKASRSSWSIRTAPTACASSSVSRGSRSRGHRTARVSRSPRRPAARVPPAASLRRRREGTGLRLFAGGDAKDPELVASRRIDRYDRVLHLRGSRRRAGGARPSGRHGPSRAARRPRRACLAAERRAARRHGTRHLHPYRHLHDRT